MTAHSASPYEPRKTMRPKPKPRPMLSPYPEARHRSASSKCDFCVRCCRSVKPPYGYEGFYCCKPRYGLLVRLLKALCAVQEQEPSDD